MTEKKTTLLLIDDDTSLCRVLEHQLNEEGYVVTSASGGREGLALHGKEHFDIVVTDIAMPDMSGMQVLEEVRSRDTDTIIILITAYGTVEEAIRACRMGADDYITKPFGIEQLLFVIEKARQLKKLENENISLKAELEQRFGLENLVGGSVAMQEVYRLINKVAATDTTVLIQGESGTGKELVARAVHTLGKRKGKLFVPVDCAAIPDTLIESELFGHEKGAFTGAYKDRKGKFESAGEGTIFLDEIGDLREELQAKLLRVLQEKRISRVGSDMSIPVDVRIISASNRDLQQAVLDGNFRKDLYYRLAIIVIDLPPLRQRREDIPALTRYFLNRYAGKRKMYIEDTALEKLKKYDFPGNVRELENIIERAVVLAEGGSITLHELPGQLSGDSISLQSGEVLGLEEIEKRAVTTALRKSAGNQTKAAELLNIPRHMLLYRMKKWNLK